VRFFKTRDFIAHGLAGNGPILVHKSDGAVHQFWSGDSLENQLKPYETLHGLTPDETPPHQPG
jgi:hypothetical protein